MCKRFHFFLVSKEFLIDDAIVYVVKHEVKKYNISIVDKKYCKLALPT